MNDTFANRLIKALEMNKMNRSELAEKIGVRKSSVSDWANGRYEAGQDNLLAIAKALNVSPSWLMGYGPDQQQTTIKGVLIKVLGSVPAGIPIEAIEDVIGYEEITEKLAETGEFFALRIQGDSMSPKIVDGDVVIVKQQPDVESGEIAIVIIDGQDATCKRVVKNGDGIMLAPTNPAYEPAHYSAEKIRNIPVKIVGKVIELRRKF